MVVKNLSINTPLFKATPSEYGMQITFDIPRKDLEPEPLSNDQCVALSMDILGAFSKRIIESLKRRQEACVAKLVKNMGSAFVQEFGTQIFFKEGKRLCTFNIPSYQVMDECIDMLQNSQFREILEHPQVFVFADQMLKALLNDPEQNHEDAGGFKYSQLVSLLCEIHMYHA
jgi:hypothetical protein